ncbi:glycosyltransferase family 39 protein [Mucilaginibacter sp. BT774]|uniref:ArnT family glycosyltransferase n=1 Tax=Mucilaginibacter sp. BT774 TaxID=3062276 RepID=UPI002674FD50|nr:glycosyltransferase family 39 protein [Mucilaginibacter sp. BT774]MDO3624838.1 glycosyltransferase family 39 protein [Mucilaginibacter sp. BT774]
MEDGYKPYFILLFVLALVVNFAGIDQRFFTDDPGLYASISKNLLYHKSFFDLFTYDQNWLDKPHFPFWMTLLSFKIFGVSVWAYRLPALIFFLICLRYTFLFGKKFHNEQIAWLAAIIVATSQHVIMLNTDVRAEPYLMALVIGSIYHISCLEERFSYIDLLLGALLTACAIITKGIFVIVAIYGALFGQLFFKKNLKSIFQLKWGLLLLLTLIFTLPEFYALYTQFDQHPEITVFNRHGVSGIRWFLWDSQFGRFVNNGPISQKKSGDIIFYLHTLLWAFAPWCLLFYYAVYKNIRRIISKRQLAEYYSISGGLLLLTLFSLSKFQLPFYTNTIFPLFAIITAPYCFKPLKRFGIVLRQMSLYLYAAAFIIITFAINYFAKPEGIIFFMLDCVVLAAGLFIVVPKIRKPHLRAFFLACIAVLFANFYLNAVFYNVMADYNGQIKAANYVNIDSFNGYHLYSLKFENNIFQFYSKRPIDYIPLDSFKNFNPPPHSIFYARKLSIDILNQQHVPFKILSSFPNYPQENILPAFVNAATRETVLDSVYLITK